MHAIPGADHCDALAGRPPGKMLKVEVAAGGAGIFGVHMQIGMKFHGVPCLADEIRTGRAAESFGRIPGEEQGTVWTNERSSQAVPKLGRAAIHKISLGEGVLGYCREVSARQFFTMKKPNG